MDGAIFTLLGRSAKWLQKRAVVCNSRCLPTGKSPAVSLGDRHGFGSRCQISGAGAATSLVLPRLFIDDASILEKQCHAVSDTCLRLLQDRHVQKNERLAQVVVGASAADARFLGLHDIGGSDVAVEGTSLILGHPDAHQVATNLLALGEPTERRSTLRAV
jgi:hypothetical protein